MWLSREIFLTFILTLSVNGEGPTCSQNGVGPKDMMMSPGKMNPRYMWQKDGGGRVRVDVVLDHEYSNKERSVIFGGLAEMASKTCIKFYVHKHASEVYDGDYVHVSKTKSKGCWSYVGKQGGKQDLSLPRGCINHRTVMHEMMHALGFSHEHVRADRDKYVRILWENIQQGRERNFQRKHDSKSDAFGPYDYSSIMHYEKNAFTVNGQDTVRPLRGFIEIGKGKRMSYWDANKINRMYECHNDGGGDNSIFGHGGIGHSPERPDNPDHSPGLNFVPNQSFMKNPFSPSHHDSNSIEDSDMDYNPFERPSYFDDYYS